MTPAQHRHHRTEQERRKLRAIARFQPGRDLNADQQLKELLPLQNAIARIASNTSDEDDYHTAGARLMWACEFALGKLARDTVPPLWAGHNALAQAWLEYQRGNPATPEQIAAMRGAAHIVAQMLAMVQVREHMVAVLDGLDANNRANWSDDFAKRWAA